MHELLAWRPIVLGVRTPVLDHRTACQTILSAVRCVVEKYAPSIAA